MILGAAIPTGLLKQSAKIDLTQKIDGPINSKLQHPRPGKPWAFDCHPCPGNGEFEPCLGKVELEPELSGLSSVIFFVLVWRRLKAKSSLSRADGSEVKKVYKKVKVTNRGLNKKNRISNPEFRCGI